VEVAVEVAMKNGAERLAVPVAVRREPFHVRMVLLTVTPVRSRPIVPVLVIVPPVRPLLVATDVTVPVLDVRQTPPTATHPPYGRLMPAKVEVAVDDAYVNDTAPANDVEAALVKLFTPLKVLLLVRVDVAVRYVAVSIESVPLAEVLTKPADDRLSRRRMLAVRAVKAVVEAYGNTEAIVEVALKRPRVSCSELEPVRVVPFDA
jgi:hypothetical protein